MFSAEVTNDGNYLLLVKHEGMYYTVHYNELKNNPLTSKLDFKPLIKDAVGEFDYINNYGKNFYFKTDFEANNGRIVMVNLDNVDEKNWKTIIPEDKNNVL
jgi:prolyl oligopeptidase